MPIRTPWDAQIDRGGRAELSAVAGAQGPVLHTPRVSGLTYESFYGLKEKPFSLSSDSRFFYHSSSHAPAFDELLAGIRRRESLSVLTGDIGTGKTTLCRTVLQHLDQKTFSAIVPDPFASREDLLKVVLMDFGVLSVDDLTSGRLKNASRTELSYLLYEFLGTLAPLQAFAVVIIDEAQNLSLPLLEEIRILSDSDGRERQLQVVLVGQLELRQKLKLPEMRQVDQRVSVHCHLSALDRDGVAGYVAHRLQTAGGSPDRIRFSPDALDVVARVSGGVPRLINRLCDRALHHGYLRRVGTIESDMVDAAVRDADLPPAPPAPLVVTPVAAPPQAAPLQAAPVKAAASPAAPVPVEYELSDPVDEWLNEMDHDARVPRRGPAPPRPAGPFTPAAVTSGSIAAVADRDRAPRLPPQFLPRTAVQQFTHRWTRRLTLVALWTLGLTVATLSTPTLWNASADVWGLAVELTASPVALPLPAARPFAVPTALALPPPPDVEPADVPAAGEPVVASLLADTR